MILVSIVIPAYNQARFVAQAVRSALNQTHRAIEVIVVDDGSTDETPDLLGPFAERKNVHVIRQWNQGLPAARNRGLQEARGEFVCFLDSDDMLAPEHVERLMTPLLADSAVGFAYCNVQIVDEAGKPSSQFSVGESRRTLSGDIFESLLVGGYFPPHAVLVRRSLLDELGDFALDLGGHADYELWLRLTASGQKAVYVDERLAIYRVYDGTMSRDTAHMRQTRQGALERVVHAYPSRVARALGAVQEATLDVYTANAWLRDRMEPALRRIETGGTTPAWTLMDRFADATLVSGKSSNLSVWETDLGGAPHRAVYLHPPSVLQAVVPTGAAGRLTAAIAIHPDAWSKPRACACTFSIDVNKTVAATALLDPSRRPSDQRWFDLAIDVPASTNNQHVITLETQAVGAPLFGWALFKDVRFFAAGA